LLTLGKYLTLFVLLITRETLYQFVRIIIKSTRQRNTRNLKTSALFYCRAFNTRLHLINTNYLSIYSAVGSAPNLIERPKEPNRPQPKRLPRALSLHTCIHFSL